MLMSHSGQGITFVPLVSGINDRTSNVSVSMLLRIVSPTSRSMYIEQTKLDLIPLHMELI